MACLTVILAASGMATVIENTLLDALKVKLDSIMSSLASSRH